PGFFATMRIGFVAGRPFAEGDDASAERVAIVNEALAAALWPGRDPLGQTLRTSGFDARVVGLVREARYFSLERSSGPELYLPIRQTSDAAVVDLVVRTAEGAGSIGPAIMAALGRVDRDLPRMTVREMTTLIDQAVFERRSVALLVLAFAGFGLLLAALGLYAVIAYSVQQRRQEIAVRLALGATPADVERLVLRETVALVALGTALGIPGAWLVSKAIRGLLYGVTATDPLTVVAVLAILAGVAVAAGLLPARRAARTEALTALQAS
ncbi:MAG: FtsX-like permease family protein, partial [Gemmatimonadales bacterium]